MHLLALEDIVGYNLCKCTSCALTSAGIAIAWQIDQIPAVVDGKVISEVKATYNDEEKTFPVFVVGNAVSIVNTIDFTDVEGLKYVELTAVYGYEGAENYGFNYAGRYFGTDATDGDFLAVLYEATIPVDATEVGIVITMVNGVELAEAEELKAIGVLGSTTPKFAIALVDEGIESFKCAPYYKDASGNTVTGVAKYINK